MSSTEVDQALARAKRLVTLYERRVITQASLLNEIVDLVTPDNIRGVMQCLPPNVLALVRDWARTLPDEHTSKVIFWPVSDVVRLSFKEWLRDDEAQNGCRNGG